MSEALNHKGIWTDDASKTLSEAANRSTQVAKEYLTLYGVTNNIANINTLLVPRAEIESLRAERDALKADAERYRWLRAQQWQENKLGVVLRPKDNTHLGTFIPSLKLLDDAIDHMSKEQSKAAAIDAAKEQQ